VGGLLADKSVELKISNKKLLFWMIKCKIPTNTMANKKGRFLRGGRRKNNYINKHVKIKAKKSVTSEGSNPHQGIHSVLEI
jgi:hypothetical protein